MGRRVWSPERTGMLLWVWSLGRYWFDRSPGMIEGQNFATGNRKLQVKGARVT